MAVAADGVAEVGHASYHDQVSLKRYLTVCYVIMLAALLLAAVIASSDTSVSFLEFLLSALVLAAGNTFIQIWPFARMVPEDQRNGFWSYKWTSLIFIALPVSLLLVSSLAIRAGKIIAS